jgi:lysozyme family protein
LSKLFDSHQSIIVPTYMPLLDRCIVTKQVEADTIADRIRTNINRYNEVERATGVPALFIAALHNMECSGDFNQHLANGDPIDRSTVNEPVGIAAGTWLETAIAALALKDWANNSKLDWDNKWLWLWRAEMWNGWGVRMYHPEVNTPYLWSGTNQHTKGKYVSDGKWDANAVSEQIGCVAIWKALGI